MNKIYIHQWLLNGRYGKTLLPDWPERLQNRENSTPYIGQSRHGQFLAGKVPTVQWRPHQRRAAAAAFYSAKSWQGLGLGGLARCGVF